MDKLSFAKGAAAVGFAVSVGYNASQCASNARLEEQNSTLMDEAAAAKEKLKKVENDKQGISKYAAKNASEAKKAGRAVGELYAIQNYTQCMALGESVLHRVQLYNRLSLGGNGGVNCKDYRSIQTMREIASKACSEAIRALPKKTDDDPHRIDRSRIVKSVVDGIKIVLPKGFNCNKREKPDSGDLYENLFAPHKGVITL